MQPLAQSGQVGDHLRLRSGEGIADTGLLRPITRDRGLSLGDRACLALGKRLGVPVLTADKDGKKLRAGVVVQLVR